MPKKKTVYGVSFVKNLFTFARDNWYRFLGLICLAAFIFLIMSVVLTSKKIKVGDVEIEKKPVDLGKHLFQRKVK